MLIDKPFIVMISEFNRYSLVLVTARVGTLSGSVWRCWYKFCWFQTNENDPHKSDHTVPEGLTLKDSTIPGAGKGIFADTLIQRGSRFGPYLGVEIPEYDELNAHASGYCWLVSIEDVIISEYDEWDAYASDYCW